MLLTLARFDSNNTGEIDEQQRQLKGGALVADPNPNPNPNPNPKPNPNPDPNPNPNPNPNPDPGPNPLR